MKLGRFIQIHGTSGAGKTTLMRRVMSQLDMQGDEHFDHSWIEKKTGKTRSRTFLLGNYYGTASLTGHPHSAAFVGGSYKATCGGLDSFSAPGIADSFYPRLIEIAGMGHDVLMEGLIQMSMGRAIGLAELGHEVHAIFLDTPLEVCLDRIRQRRLEAGNTKELNTENTEIKHRDKPRIMKKLAEGRVKVALLGAEEAESAVLELLRTSLQ